ncbi:MAG: thioredoxin [Deltaproteobacteria bacterium]|nr:MAG: thioredoxin [Deltaproteobacteria bacterium]
MVYDATSEDFETVVLERSFERPVLVDFWAPWCGPCRAMAPLIERLSAELADRIDVVKLDTDAHPELASRFGIRGIPNLKIFRDGKIVGEQVGAVGYRELVEFVERHAPSEATLLVERARALLAAGDREQARGLLERAVELAPGHGPARLELARLAVAEGDREAYQRHRDAVAPAADEAERIANLEALLELREVCETRGGMAATRREVADEPTDPDPWYAHGACLAAEGEFEAALEAFMAAIERTTRPHDTPAHRALLALFTELGPGHPLAETYKRRLQIYL